jgi:hypothetical protein
MDIISTFESSSPAITSSREIVERVPNITISSPHREPKFVTANLDPFRPIGRLGQPPVQFAAPKDGTRINSGTIQDYNLSSSTGAELPQSISPDQLMPPIKRKASYSATTLGEEDEEDIEEGAVAAHRRLQRLKDQSYPAGDMTSSGVQGNAAFGLLKLMSGKQ